MKLYERYIRFVNNITTTIMNEQMTRIKVGDLHKLLNFVVEPFFNFNYFCQRKICMDF
jgi:hypothetical protein